MCIHSKYFTTQFSIFNSSFFSVPALLVPERQFLPAPEWVYVIIVHNILHYTPRIITLLLKGRAHEQVIKYACESTCTHLFPHIHVIGLCSFHKILRRKNAFCITGTLHYDKAGDKLFPLSTHSMNLYIVIRVIVCVQVKLKFKVRVTQFHVIRTQNSPLLHTLFVILLQVQWIFRLTKCYTYNFPKIL